MKSSHIILFMFILVIFCFQSVTISDDAAFGDITLKDIDSLKFKYDTRITYPIPHLLEKYYSDKANSDEFAEYAQSIGFSTLDYKVQVVIEFINSVEDYFTPDAIERYDIYNAVMGEKWVEGYVPVYNLEKIVADYTEIHQIRPVRRVEDNAVTTEGLALVNAPAWHSAGYTGSGIKIAVIDSGFQHINNMISAGDFTSSFVSQDFTGSGFPGTGDHGTECASIVYDFVPNASFYLIIIATDADFELAKNYCIANGIDVISMSLGWLGYWYGDGQGGVSDVANELASNGILLVNSAGNHANNYFWTGSWSDSDNDDLIEFSGTDETNTVSLSSGQSVSFRLTWDTSLNNSDQDYDMYLLDSSNTIVASSENEQSGTQQPLEIINYNVTSTGTYHVVINRYSATGSSNFRLFCTNSNTLQYASTARSILDPGNATGAFTVGAIAEYNWNNNPVPIEGFSSRGPTSDGRIKPDICGPDGTTAHYGSGLFYGTSGACPHVAGAATLFWSSNPSLTFSQVRTYLENNAIDCGTSGKDNTFGYGKLELGVPGPDKVILISPPNNSVDQPTTINFQWQQPSGTPTNYQLQVSTNNTFSSTYYDNNTITSTSQQVLGLATGTKYYWRVRASNGYWGDWSDTWNFTTVTLPGPITLTSPTNNATDQPLSLNFQWQQPLTGTLPFTYQLQVSTNNGFTAIVYNNSSITNTTQLVTGLAYDNTYYWRVRAINVAGSGPWSSVWSFSTIESPGQVVLNSPSNNAKDQQPTLTLQWNVPTGTAPLTYHLQVSTNNGFTSNYYDNSNIASTSQQISGLSLNTTYYWRVRANNVAGWGQWSLVWQFTTIEPPGQVTLQSPSNNATDQSTTLNLQWNAPGTGTPPFTYQLQVSIDSSFDKIIIDKTNINGTSNQVSGLIYDTTYYWRVRANNPAGWGIYSHIWQFTTYVPPSFVTLDSPANEQTDLLTDVTFKWNQPANGTAPLTYQLQVSTDSSFATTVYDKDNLSSDSQQVTGLAFNKIYYWRVQAKNVAGDSGFSEIWQFSTAMTPGTIDLISPTDKATEQLDTLTFEWQQAISGTTPMTYNLQISENSSFTSTVYDNNNISQTTQSITGLSFDRSYYWRVRAKNIAGWGNYSNTRQFDTATLPEKVELISPVNEIAFSKISLPFAWFEPTNGTTPFKYQLQIAKDESFTDIVYDDDSINALSIKIDKLEYKTTYYWRVRAQNKAGWGDWSETWTFDIKSKPGGGCSFGIDESGNKLNTFWLAIIFVFTLVIIRKFKH